MSRKTRSGKKGSEKPRARRLAFIDSCTAEDLFFNWPSRAGSMRVKSNLATAGTVLFATALLVIAAVITANAATSESPAELIKRVAPLQGEVSILPQDSTAAFTTHTVSLPVDPEKPITLHGADGMELPVSLPAQLKVTSPEASADGTLVYTAETGGVSFATQMLDNGIVRMQTILSSPDDPHSFTYELGNGFTLVEAADGSLWACRFNNAGEIELFSVGEAWARDANGADVATRYEINGNKLTQVIQPSADTAYPVVADPTWQ